MLPTKRVTVEFPRWWMCALGPELSPRERRSPNMHQGSLHTHWGAFSVFRGTSHTRRRQPACTTGGTVPPTGSTPDLPGEGSRAPLPTQEPEAHKPHQAGTVIKNGMKIVLFLSFSVHYFPNTYQVVSAQTVHNLSESNYSMKRAPPPTPQGPRTWKNRARTEGSSWRQGHRGSPLLQVQGCGWPEPQGPGAPLPAGTEETASRHLRRVFTSLPQHSLLFN